MNTFEMDLKRALFSKGFLIGLIIEILILDKSGFASDFYLLCMPVVVAFPYATAWLNDYHSGYIKLYLYRTGVKAYIVGKFIVAALSGGILLTLSILVAQWIKGEEMVSSFIPVFASGCLWAAVATTLSAITSSRYVAYGSGFVIYYLLIILYERYFTWLYCLYPEEWIKPQHTWVFDEYGVMILLLGIVLVLFAIFYAVVRRCIERV
ncbi:MAG: hypothetical protein IJO70_02870 [Lachnospiraceae bacterium]|nr:hypothetical protein [Lachnospiraceae bacterium]